MSKNTFKKLLAASALTVFAVSAAPAVGQFIPQLSAQAFAQTEGFPIIVNEAQFKELVAKGAKIVDSRQPAAFANGHIPGATNLPWAKLNVSERDGIRNEFSEDEVFNTVISEAGLNADDTLIIYDTNSLPGRAFIALEYAGFKNIHVLDGGVAGYTGELSTDPVKVEKSNFKITEKRDMRVDKAYVESKIRSQDTVIVDGRNSDAYVDGHIPGAKSLTAARLLTDDKKIVPEDVLTNLLASRCIDKNKEILSYCGSGVAAANNYVALRNLGYTNVVI